MDTFDEDAWMRAGDSVESLLAYETALGERIVTEQGFGSPLDHVLRNLPVIGGAYVQEPEEDRSWDTATQPPAGYAVELLQPSSSVTPTYEQGPDGFIDPYATLSSSPLESDFDELDAAFRERLGL
ncbi:TPA: hypothetical protein HA278_01090 [Candidatus Woesearchaeota archaeon]|nr:hypothetical protein [archaeon]HIJ10627.1 hypothetical protein [Candidatus Woesearchaeota archaeon]